MILAVRNLVITCMIICLITYLVCRKMPDLKCKMGYMVLLSTFSLLVLWLTGVSPRNGLQFEIDWTTVQMTPLQGIKTVLYNGVTAYAIENILGNVVMMMPIGFLLPLCFKSLRKWYISGVIGFMFSLLIECSQLFLWRGTDIDDVLLNTVGTLMGYLSWRIFRRRLELCSGLQEVDGLWNILWVVALLLPYFVELSVGFLDFLIGR